MGGSDGKESAWNVGDPGSIPRSGWSPGEGNGNPLRYSCLENSMDRRAWWATVHGVPKSQTHQPQTIYKWTDRLCYNKSLFQRQKGWIWLQPVLSNSSVTASQTKNLKISSGHRKKYKQVKLVIKWSHSVLSNALWPHGLSYQAPPSMRFSRQDYWSGLPFPSPGGLPDPGIEPRISCIPGKRFNLWATREAQKLVTKQQ